MLLKKVLLNHQIRDILIRDNTITQIAASIDTPDDMTWDCTGKAVFPSFANTHTHAAMMFLRGIGEDQELFTWLNTSIWPREAKLKPEHIYPLSRFAILEMIKTGTTFFCDMYGDPEETVRAVNDMGIRAMIPYVGMDFFDDKETERRLIQADAFLSKQSPSHRIIKGTSAHAIYTCSEKLIKTLHQQAQDNQTYFHIHLSETAKEVQECIEKHGCRPVELLYKWGVLGPKTVLAHGVHFNETELQLLTETQAIIAHCPTSNLKLGSGCLDFQKYWDNNLKMTLGTDSVSSNNSLSMMTEMKIAALSAKKQGGSVLSGRVQDIFQTATQNGFQAFGFNAGKIKVGALADFILVDLNNPLLLPNDQIDSHLIYAADSSCITDVICDGKPVMQNKIVPGEVQIIDEFKRVVQELNHL